MATTGWQPLSKYRRASPLGKEQGGDNLNDDAHHALKVRSAQSGLQIQTADFGSVVGYPEVWMMDHAKLRGTVKREQVGELTIPTPSLRLIPIGK